MSCYFCGGSRIASIHSAPDRGVCNWSVGSMTLTRRYDGEPIVRVELDTSVSLDVSVNGLCGDTVSADVTADAYIEDIKACLRCGLEPVVEDARERSLDRPNVMSVTCPSCGMSNRIAWGSLMATPQKEAVSMLADSWNSR